MRKHYVVRRMALSSILAALYLILCLADFSYGRFKFTLAALVPIFVSLALPPIDAISVCLLGVFLDQLVYGLSPTTALWMVPPLLRPALIIPFTYFIEKKGGHMENHKVLSVILISVSSLLVSAANSLALYLDSIIYGYPYAAVLVDNILQALLTMGTGILLCFLIFPLIKALRKADLLFPFTFKRKINQEGNQEDL